MQVENKPVYIYDAFEGVSVPVYNDIEVNSLSAPFIINVPAAITLNANLLTRMRAITDIYRIPGKNDYSIQTY